MDEQKAMNLIDSLTADELQFIKAVVEDEHYEFYIGDGEKYSLFTDYEGDGTFLPSVTILRDIKDEETEKQTVSDLTEEFDWLVHRGIDTVDKEKDIAHAYFISPEIDDKYLKAVRKTL